MHARTIRAWAWLIAAGASQACTSAADLDRTETGGEPPGPVDAQHAAGKGAPAVGHGADAGELAGPAGADSGVGADAATGSGSDVRAVLPGESAPDHEIDECADIPDGSGAALSVLEGKREGLGAFSPTGVSVGDSLGLDRDTFAVGVRRGSLAQDPKRGVVHVFRWDSEVAEAVLEAPAQYEDAGFTAALALSGDTLAVSAIGGTSARGDETRTHGRVHVFERSDGAWSHLTALSGETPSEDDAFGAALALEGDTLVASTYLDELGGLVEIFVRGDDGWQRSQVLTPIEAESAAGFGASVALEGDTLAIGATWSVGEPGQSVHVFVRREGRWEPSQLLRAPEGSASFGRHVALSGRILAITDGRGLPAPAGATRGGVVHVFERACDGELEPRAVLEPPPEIYGSSFGSAVAVDGGRVVVADGADSTSGSGFDADGVRGTYEDDVTGAVHVFGRTEDGYERLGYLKDTVEAQRENRFGHAVAARAGKVLVGARGEGAVYLLR